MSSRRREKRLKVLGNVGLAALAVVTAGAVAAVVMPSMAPPPVSAEVQKYYDVQVANRPAILPRL